ncbi:MAG: hypothetical protein ABW022_21565 [Actinoplanes sp.]
MAVAATLTIGLTPAAAQAAPKPAAKPNIVQITGDDLTGTIVVEQADQDRLFGSLLSEVSWMANARGQAATPKVKLGKKYTLTVLNKTQPMQVYDLYPLAAGGPRALRPAAQPGGKKTAAWFYGRLTMPEALRVSGVPLDIKPDVVGGGIGGGVGENLSADELDPVAEVNGFLGEMRRLFLLNGAVLIVIMFGLAGIAFLIRRRV